MERLGSQLGEAALGKFSNGEKSVEIRIFPEYDCVDDDRLFREKSGCVYSTVGIGDVFSRLRAQFC